MNFSDKEKKHILKDFIVNLTSVSNKKSQKRVWIEGKGPEWDSFDHTVCAFCGEGDSVIEDWEYFGITDNQHNVLVNFRNIFDAFLEGPNSHDPAEFIDTPEWGKITEMAGEVLAAFYYPIDA